MGEALTASTTFEIEHCYECGVPFAMTADFQKRRLQDHDSFYCPAGHSQYYPGKTDTQKLRELLEKEEKRRRWAESQNHRLTNKARALRGVITRTKNRIGNGTCPCCKRSFQNLKRHMTTKHPNYSKGSK